MTCDKDFGYVRLTRELTCGHYGDLWHGTEARKLKVDFRCYTRRRYGYLATDSVEIYIFKFYFFDATGWNLSGDYI